MTRRFLALGLAAASLLVAACGQRMAAPADNSTHTVAADSLARQILEDSQPLEARRALVAAHPDKAVPLMLAMVNGLDLDTEEEYRRIPWIWRVTVAAGERNDPDEIRRVLKAALPAPGAPLLDWQAVVIGGGVIGGIARAGDWPAERVAVILADHPELRARWQYALDRAAEMADDPQVPDPTRYDALRMIAMEPWAQRGAQLVRYLGPDVSDELQMGAIDGLADMPVPEASEALLAHLEHFPEKNRGRALDALLRDDARIAALLEAVADGRVAAADLGEERIARLKAVDEAALEVALPAAGTK